MIFEAKYQSTAPIYKREGYQLYQSALKRFKYIILLSILYIFTIATDITREFPLRIISFLKNVVLWYFDQKLYLTY